MAKPTITIVGPGNLGAALAVALHAAGYRVEELISRGVSPKLRQQARKIGAGASSLTQARLDSRIVWLCVPDDAIAAVATALALRADWKGKIALHSSGALPSDELQPLRRQGAPIASIHPMMTFVRDSSPVLAGVLFTVEGDPAAVRAARGIVRDLKGEIFTIDKRNKTLYHACGSFSSPLVIATLAMAERVASAAGMTATVARKAIAPILRQTIDNYVRNGAAAAFSGPIIRGDLDTIRRHLRELKKVPHAREVYVALVRSALDTLPVSRRDELRKLLAG